MKELGTLLREEREKLKLSVQDVAEKTKIRYNVIEQLEEGNWEEISPVYARSFARSYLNFLKLPEETLNQFIKSPNQKEKKSETSSNLDHIKAATKVNYANIFNKKKYAYLLKSKIFTNVVYGLISFGFVFILYLLVFTETDNDSFVSGNTGLLPDTVILSSSKESNNAFSAMFSSDSLIIEGRAIDTAWIRIDIDGKRSEELLMLPQQYKRWSAGKFVKLTQGNVGAIQFSRNGKVLEPFGARGTVVKNVLITQDEIKL